MVALNPLVNNVIKSIQKCHLGGIHYFQTDPYKLTLYACYFGPEVYDFGSHPWVDCSAGVAERIHCR